MGDTKIEPNGSKISPN